MNIFYCVNKIGMEPLGASITSLIWNTSSPLLLKFNFLCNGIDQSDKDNLSNLIYGNGITSKINFIDFDAKRMYGHLPSLHGDWTSYGKMLVPKYAYGNALFIDSDTIVLCDVFELDNFDFKNNLIAVQGVSKVEKVLDSKVFVKRGWKDVDYFNSGVILFNSDLWKPKTNVNLNIIARSTGADLISHEQTLLNLYFKGTFALLPKGYNNVWRASKEGTYDGIIHFAGSPKPWDLFGSLHKGVQIYDEYNPTWWNKIYGKLSFKKFLRAFMIRKSIIRLIFKSMDSIPSITGAINVDY